MSPDAGHEWRVEESMLKGRENQRYLVNHDLRHPETHVSALLIVDERDAVWLADCLNADHNAALLLAEAREALGEISSGAFKRMRDSHNQRGSDGPCDCTICRTYDVAAAALSRISASLPASEAGGKGAG